MGRLAGPSRRGACSMARSGPAGVSQAGTAAFRNTRLLDQREPLVQAASACPARCSCTGEHAARSPPRPLPPAPPSAAPPPRSFAAASASGRRTSHPRSRCTPAVCGERGPSYLFSSRRQQQRRRAGALLPPLPTVSSLCSLQLVLLSRDLFVWPARPLHHRLARTGGRQTIPGHLP